MPVKKKKNLKNARPDERDHHLVPIKEEVGRHYGIKIQGPRRDLNPKRVTGLTTAGKRKRPK